MSLCYSLLPKTFLTDLSDLLVGKGEGISYPVVHLVSIAEPHLIITTWCNDLINKNAAFYLSMKADLSVDLSSFPLIAVILTRGDHCQVGILLMIIKLLLSYY